jgi:predicted Zn finger-like uncharacterized protein
MIVHCEGCESGFHVDEHLIKPTGSKLRCSKCRHVFTAYPPAPADEAEEPLTLGDALPAAETAPGPAEMSDIDAQLDQVFDEATGQAPELLDVEDLLSDESPPQAASTAREIGAELDLDLAPVAATDEGDTLPGLDELGIGLSMLDATAEVDETALGKGATQAELKLDRESLALEGAETGAAAGLKRATEAAKETAVQAGDSSRAVLADLDFDLEMVDAKTTPLPKDTGESAKSSDIDEIDISDLEDMLDGPGLAATAPAAARGGDLDLDLDLEPKAVAPAGVPQPTDTLDLSMFAEELKPTGELASEARGDELELELDLEPETVPTQAEASAEAPVEADELDFSDISAMLEQEEKPVAVAAGEPLEDVDLDLETLLNEDHGAASAGKPEEAPEAFELDVVPEEVRGISTDLEIEFEPEPAAPPVKRQPVAAAAQTSVAAAARAAVAATDNFATDDFTNVVATGETSVLEPAPVAEPAARKKPAAAKYRRAGSRKPVLAVIGVLVLAVAALILPRSLGIHIPYLSDLQIPYLSELDIEIPFIGNIFKSEPEDSAGRLKLALVPEAIAAEFVANPSAGMLCVVKGQVRNSYNHPRSGLRVAVTLYKAGNVAVKTATVFAGNVLSNQELTSLDLIAINARLKISTGANNMNVGVKPGRSVPFMAVFSNLPAGLEEYSVEVAGSTP